METIWINGEYMPLSDATLPIEERSVMFADGIYEVIAAYDGVPILLEEHLDRWERSAEGIQLSAAYSRDERYEVIAELLRRLNVPRAMIYGQLSRGTGPRAHQFPKTPKPIEFWFARELPPKNEKNYRDGVAVITHPDERWKRCWIKSTCLLPNVLAKQKAQEAGAFEAVLHTDEGIVTEVAAANFWMVKDGRVYTHPADGAILAGCKRAMVAQVARDAGIEVREEKCHLDFLRKADEAFITSTTINVLPVTTLDGNPIGGGKVGPVASRLGALVDQKVAELKAQGLATR